jgi:hypothetical protein
MLFTTGLRGTPSARIFESPFSLEGLVQAGRSSLQTFSAGVYFLKKCGFAFDRLCGVLGKRFISWVPEEGTSF